MSSGQEQPKQGGKPEDNKKEQGQKDPGQEPKPGGEERILEIAG